MPAYWIARARVDNLEQYHKYADRVPAILQRFGGRALARGGRCTTLEGLAWANRFAVIEFPTLDMTRACFDSDEYQAVAFRRDGGCVVEIAIVEGVGT
jgi:uncharacterized protein (DUF1330 family)